MQRRFIRQQALILSLLVIMGTLITFTLIGNSIRLQTVHAVSQTRSLPAASFSNVLSTFYPNPDDSGVFDASSTTTPAFTQSFPTLDFNPPTSLQFCSNNTGVDENTRPFTNIVENADGSCTISMAQGSGQQPAQAGVGNLSSFEAEFLATLTVPQAGQFDMDIYADDGWLLSIGPDASGNQPVYTAGPLNNAPSNLKGPFSGYTVIGANNVPESPTQSTVTATFPVAGNYPIELDYTECCGGQLTLVVGDASPSIVTPTPTPSTTPTPGGSWIQPDPNAGQFTITGDILHLAAHADRTNSWDPAIEKVIFTVYFVGVNPTTWFSACEASSPTPETTDQYECDWNLAPSVPNGPVTISFDVYDVLGNKTLAPNGTLTGLISRSPQHLLLAPFPQGITMTLLNGYNNPLPDPPSSTPCPAPGENEHDHCMNQQYGFDFVATSTTPNGLHIIAPESGTVAWIGKDKNANEYCIGLTLDMGNVNMTICHFASLNGDLSNKHVGQGYFLGIMADHIHISMDDRYLDTTHSACSPTNGRTCRPVAFDGYYALEGQNYDPGDPNANWQPVLNQYGCSSPTDTNCIQVTSTNPETTTLS